jgi:membrane protease YdiL (CAAX protease family)
MTDLAIAPSHLEQQTRIRRLQLATVAGLALTLGMTLHVKVVPDWIRAALFDGPYRSVVDGMMHSMASLFVWEWTVVALLVVIVVRFERRTIASMGWRPLQRRDLAWVGGAWVLSVAAMLFLPGRDFVQQDPMQSIFALPVSFRVLLVFTAAVTEEVIHRAYIVERIADLTGRAWIGGVLTCAIFAAGHVPFFGLRTVLFVQLPGAILMTVLYVRRRNLKASILLHLLIDLPILLPASMVSG